MALAKGKEKVSIDENSVVGQKNSKERVEPEVISPIKPNLISEAEKVVGFLDISHGKENKPKTKAKWKQLARKQGQVSDIHMVDRKSGFGTKHVSEIEALEVKEKRVTKKTRVDGHSFDEQQTKEMAVVARQHCRK